MSKVLGNQSPFAQLLSGPRNGYPESQTPQHQGSLRETAHKNDITPSVRDTTCNTCAKSAFHVARVFSHPVTDDHDAIPSSSSLASTTTTVSHDPPTCITREIARFLWRKQATRETLGRLMCGIGALAVGRKPLVKRLAGKSSPRTKPPALVDVNVQGWVAECAR
ncbi:hypothetical protein K458DRAFT_89993 [Lentithecium fluviatile CBS 122367]|uniref:Uncharacterized protein n=1 Tax=Lentithecium fluviatile CBS 122367 TaxID=1168545 RepID=A0A6G1IRL5_9PLEO|nr:hypothetical protein K458DRAFT_89993 [Lentithecium fluviatile CBS 122367]